MACFDGSDFWPGSRLETDEKLLFHGLVGHAVGISQLPSILLDGESAHFCLCWHRPLPCFFECSNAVPSKAHR